METEPLLTHALDRLEASVSSLSEQVTGLRKEISQLAQNVESSIAAQHERLLALESFRRWAIGLMTGLFLSGMAAVFGYVLKR
jgi:multidrug resistance efflux pump